MAYNFTTNQIAEAFASKIPSQLPFLANINRTLDRKVRAGNGATYNIVLPDYSRVGDGPAIEESELAYETGVRSVTLEQNHVAFGATQDTRTLDIIDFAELVVKPYAQSFASHIQRKALRQARRACASAVVLNATETAGRIAGVLDFLKFRQSSGILEKARAGAGNFFGIIDPLVMASATNIANYFLPAEVAGKAWRDSVLGRYANAEWMTTADLDEFEAGTLAREGITFKVATAPTGTTITELEISYTVGTGATAPAADQTIKAGEVINVAGCSVADIYGKPLNAVPLAFVVKTDHAITAAEVSAKKFTVEVETVLVNDGAANRATGTCAAAPVANAAVTFLFREGKTYATGIEWQRDAIWSAQTKLLKMSGTAEMGEAEARNGLIVAYTTGPDIMKGREIGRWDTMFGMTTARPQWATALYLEL